jgi:hypothetical protein
MVVGDATDRGVSLDGDQTPGAEEFFGYFVLLRVRGDGDAEDKEAKDAE